MNYYYITGASSGLGKAFAEYLLSESSENFVYGISRHCTILHANYKHIEIDLNDLTKVEEFEFQEHLEAKKIALINNAGAIGLIKPVGKLSSESIIRSYHVNLISPVLLTNKFINQYQNSKNHKLIVNVSSGAGKNPVAGWSTYCSSKAALDMFSRVVDEEQKSASDKINIFSIAPGVVDTNMQQEIRNASQEDFPHRDDFINYKKHNKLTKPAEVAENYFNILNDMKMGDQVVFSVKDFDKV